MSLKKNQHRIAQHYSGNYKLTELNLMEHGDSSPSLKDRVSSLLM